MRCDVHPSSDAVGTCVYCGRGVCDQCKVRLYDKVHCKECVEAGRIKGAPEQQAPQQQGPPGPPPGMGYPQYPGYPAYPGVYMTPVIFKQPNPKGIPRKGYFQFGMVSAFAAMVVSFAVAFFMVASIMGSYEARLETDFFIVTILVLSFFMYPVFISFYGIYRNYGSPSALFTVIGGISLLPFYQFLWGWYTLGEVFHARGDGYADTFSLVFFTQVFLGGALLIATFALRGASQRMVPMSEGRRAAAWSVPMMAAAAIAFLCMFGVYIFGWILLGLAMGFLGHMFMKAPVPDPAAMMPQGPMMMPPPGQGPGPI
jgi:hypothetical protein